MTEDIFPYLLVNIGSGVSIIRVDGPGEGQYSRVSGSSVGGGTFWGLCRLLTGLRDFDEMLQLSMQGNNANVSVRGQWRGREGLLQGGGLWLQHQCNSELVEVGWVGPFIYSSGGVGVAVHSPHNPVRLQVAASIHSTPK